MAMPTDSTEIPGLEFNLLDYAMPVAKSWKWLICTALVSMCVVWFATADREDVFEAYAAVTVVDSKDIGGVAPDERRAPEVITLVEHGFVMNSMKDNALQTTLARMNSRAFTTRFVRNYGVLEAMHSEHWDSVNEIWLNGFQPDIGADRKRFVEEIRVIEHNVENDVVLIKMKWNDPFIARDWANSYIVAFNEYMRERAMNEVERRMVFLENQLKTNDIVDVDKSIYRLIEAQTAVAMLASAREYFAIEPLDPAILPYARHNTSRKKLVFLSGLISTLVACFVIMAFVLFSKLRSELTTLIQKRTDIVTDPG